MSERERTGAVCLHVPETSFPAWLTTLSAISLIVAGLCALFVFVDVVRHPQKMWVMNVVWVVVMLFGSVVWLLAYLRWARAASDDDRSSTPMAVMTFKGSNHCGAGCMIGDIIAEWAAFAVPALAVAAGWPSLFAEKMFAVWVLDFVLAYALGVFFQYFTIAPMRHLGLGRGLLAAIKADTASIASWQVGMYGAIALIQFLWLAPHYGGLAPVDSAVFWFAMQLAMLAGFATAYPINWLLIRTGWKEKM